MKYFKQLVIETRTYEVEYIVQAETAEEAANLVASGEGTVEEKEIKCTGVTNRDAWDKPTECDIDYRVGLGFFPADKK